MPGEFHQIAVLQELPQAVFVGFRQDVGVGQLEQEFLRRSFRRPESEAVLDIMSQNVADSFVELLDPAGADQVFLQGDIWDEATNSWHAIVTGTINSNPIADGAEAGGTFGDGIFTGIGAGTCTQQTVAE